MTKPAALAAGALIAIGSAMQMIPVGSRPSEVARTPLFAFSSVALLAGELLLLLALASLYVRRASQVGSFGFAAVLVAGTGIVVMCAVYWSHAFLWPSAAEVAPALLDNANVPGPYRYGEIVARLVFGIGWIMAGVALLRAHIYGHWPAIVIIVGALLTIVLGLGLGQLVFALGVIWLGFTPAYVLAEHYRRHEPVV